MVGIRRVSPAAPLTVELGLSWLVGVCALTAFGMLRKLREDRLVKMRAAVLAFGLALWFLAQAAFETCRALGRGRNGVRAPAPRGVA